jgi:hypothetical protein
MPKGKTKKLSRRPKPVKRPRRGGAYGSGPTMKKIGFSTTPKTEQRIRVTVGLSTANTSAIIEAAINYAFDDPNFLTQFGIPASFAEEWIVRQEGKGEGEGESGQDQSATNGDA